MGRTGNRDTYPHRIVRTPFIGEPDSICSEIYLCIGSFNSKREAESVLSYLTCRPTRLLILFHKPSRVTTRKRYTFVPTQDGTERWADADRYAKYRSKKMSKPIEEILAPKRRHAHAFHRVMRSL